jgi:hypothetical protein
MSESRHDPAARRMAQQKEADRTPEPARPRRRGARRRARAADRPAGSGTPTGHVRNGRAGSGRGGRGKAPPRPMGAEGGRRRVRRAESIVFGQSSRRSGPPASSGARRASRSSRVHEGTEGNSAQRLCDGVVEGDRPALSGGFVAKACQEGTFPRPAVALVDVSRLDSIGAEERNIRLDIHLTSLVCPLPRGKRRGSQSGARDVVRRWNRLRVTASRWCPCRPPASPWRW